jgi:antitoxin component of RelBE/YafQ-DinJ toxin-antitoxin module
MQLDPYIQAVQGQLAVVAEAGGEGSRAVAAQLGATLESAIRLALQDALASAAMEISVELAPGSVEVRLRGRDPEFVVVPPPADAPSRGGDLRLPPAVALDGDESASARINLRVPERLKLRIEAAANAAGLSVNAWLVRVTALAAEGARIDSRDEGISADGRHFKGWAR